ncbi:MAG: hypothetical protein HPY84_03820 [Syntrophobacteraceae bacterium]|nr:hypothetical protein [Syntrophobacteraceae bacterium]
MRWPWRFGMMIVSGVPAIVGGGLFYHFFENWTAVIVWEAVLIFVMSILIAKGDKNAAPAH